MLPRRGVRRLHAVEQTLDGFELAQIDLDLRGPAISSAPGRAACRRLETARLSDLRTRGCARRELGRCLTLTPPCRCPNMRAGKSAWQSSGAAILM